MAAASSRLPALFLLFCFYHCCMSSIHVRFAVSLSIGDRPPKAEPSVAVPDRSKAHSSSSTGRVSTYAKEVLPLRRNLTAATENVGLLPFPADTATNWNGDCHFVNRGSKLIAIHINSTEYTETISPSKNLSSARSLDYSGSLGMNTTEFCPPVFSVFQEQQAAVVFSAGSVENNVEFHNLTCFRNTQVSCSDDPTRARKLLYDKYGQRATRNPHVAIGGKVTPSWLEQPAVAGSALICAVAGLLLCCIRGRKRPRQTTAAIELEDDDGQILREPENLRGFGPCEFVHSELAAATDNFAEERKIGRGGFGPVYRGHLNEEDRHVAIKVLSQELSVQGLKEFQAEVTIMSQLRHRNIVRLVGWCCRRRELAIVYELMSGGSLDAHLYNPDRHLTWPQRYKIALQLGSALRYLHTDCDQCVVHGDIKPANIMLDASLNAKLGDFGLARLVDHGAEPQTTQVVAGTVGYIDPEFVSSRRPSAESDVYSYGVVLLEIACGRRPTPSRRASGQAGSAKALLLASVRDMYRRDVILEAADPRLDGEFDEMEMERLLVTGLWCAQQDPVRRPSVAQAVDVLRSEDVKLPVLVGSGEIRALELQAYGVLHAESSAYLDDEPTETPYLTTEETAHMFPEE